MLFLLLLLLLLLLVAAAVVFCLFCLLVSMKKDRPKRDNESDGKDFLPPPAAVAVHFVVGLSRCSSRSGVKEQR